VPLPPKDWPRVGDVFEGARALPADRRPGYLAEKCGGDEELRQEVESLLAWEGRAESLFETPVLVRVDDAIVMKNLEGQRIGPYQLASRIGAGGMGEVYKARDTRLERTVAIKVLTADIADDPQARERFQREARAVAALNHPHICTLHDVGSHDPSTGSGQPIDFLVMEYLDGETLAERLAKGPLPLDRALLYAIQISDALDKAHRQGITHRDLKPGNVMLTPLGTKLLDFGLAKLRPAAAGAVAGMSAAPNVSPSLTGRGTILGTLQYMAPEQLEGKPADARTDIFAFGALLYEMLTGKRAFEGTSQASLISAILSSDPPPIAVRQPLTPPALDRVVKKCLAKDPDERWQSAHDLTSELKWIAESGLQTAVTAPGVDTQARSRARTPLFGWIAAAMLLVTTLGLAAALNLRRAPVDTRVYRSTFVPPGNENPSLFVYQKLALSPDGLRLAFVANDANGHIVLWVRELAALTAQPLADTEGAAGPFWSPDSRFIAFSAGGKLKKIDASGGPAISLCDTNTGFPGSWGRSDVILFTPTVGQGLSRVSAAGATPTLATALDTKGGELWHRQPFFLPDGRHFLYAAAGALTSGVYVGSLDSPDRTRLLDSFANAQYASGFLVFPRDGTLMAQPFDATLLALSGQAMAVAEHVNFTRGVPPTGTLAAFTVSDTGVLAFEASRNSRLVWFDRAGKQTGILGDPARYGSGVHLSPDRSQASVVVTDSPEAANVWIFDVARGVRTPLTTSGFVSSEVAPGSIWSPDGRRVVFASTQKGPRDLFQKPSNGVGPENVLLADDFNKYPENWSPDGRFLLYMRWANGSTPDIWVLPLFGDRKPFPFIEAPFYELASQFSPDGRWLAYNSNESGRAEVYVVPFPGPGAKVRISTAGGDNARWRRDGKEIFFLAENTLTAAEVTANGSRFEVGAAQRLFDVPTVDGYWPYDVTPDGQRFLVNTLDGVVAPLTIVVNWPAGLKK
jgi:serine/threonine protein kinase/Tol biopolymer transport system component